VVLFAITVFITLVRRRTVGTGITS
jgi:hypothetical protein